MGKEELLDALVGLQAEASVEGLCSQFVVTHEGKTLKYLLVSKILAFLTYRLYFTALSDIHRKHWKFLEDACSVVLRQVFALVSSAQDEETEDFDSQKCTISTSEGVNLCLQFIEPLIHSTVSIADALDDEQEARSQRGVLVAALLHLFAKISGHTEPKELKSRLVADVLMCGVEIHVLLATLRVREELVECRRALLPSYESDSETESEVESDDDEGVTGETRQFAVEDIQWIVDRVAKAWGLTKSRYFLQTSGQEYAFAAWSYHGIGIFVHALLTDEQHGLNALPAVVSPFSWLFHIAAYAHYMIHSEDHQVSYTALSMDKYQTDSGLTDVCVV